MSTITSLLKQAQTEISQASSCENLEQLRIKYLGRKGFLSQFSAELKKLGPAGKKALGQKINHFKTAVGALLEQHQERLSDQSDPPAKNTQSAVFAPGHLHLVTQAIEEITLIFERIGFERVRYPEVDWDWYAFESLNMPQDHPARDEWETLFIDVPPDPKFGKMVLTPHTSNGQVREMLAKKRPPIRMINIAKCYRRQQDINHTIMFHQFEGLLIDTNIHIGHLKGIFDFFAQNYYGPQIKSRIRPFHFQFTEPSFEVDFTCCVCEGKGCRTCKSGWHEVGGAGMVHPNVLRAGGIDPAKYSGFAFGWGVERSYMMKPGLKIPDLRLFYQNDIRFLEQF